MKKMLLCVALAVMSLGAWAGPLVDEKVLATFRSQFPNASEVKWYESDDLLEVYFRQESTACRVTYDPSGRIIRTLRYYGGEGLPPFIRSKVEKRYPGRSVFGVTEMMSAEGTMYEVILEDEKRWYNVRFDAFGHQTLVVRSNKG